ncbi:MAG: aldo/keto reductase [Planctomycetia bacterium]|nr:aldo/keto reductase [Planctomycetia bacterium]
MTPHDPHDIKRRDFLRKSVAGAALIPLGSANAEENDSKAGKLPKDFSTDPVALVSLTDQIRCPRIGLGTGVHGGMRQCNLTRMPRKDALEIFQIAYDLGIRLFDLADLYGTHEICREALAGKPRDSYVLSSKLWPHFRSLPEKERPSADIVVKRFLKELNTDYLDLVQIHCAGVPDWRALFEPYFDDLEKLKQQGLIRAHGISFHSLTAVREAVSIPWVDVMHVRFNGANIRMDGTWEENAEALQAARAKGKGIIAMKVLGEGAIRDPEERRKSIDKVIRSQCVNAMVVGFEKKEHFTEFLNNASNTLKAMAAESV